MTLKTMKLELSSQAAAESFARACSIFADVSLTGSAVTIRNHEYDCDLLADAMREHRQSIIKTSWPTGYDLSLLD